MKEANQKAMLWIAIATILFMELLIFGGWGIAVPIAVIVYYGLVLWQSKVLKIGLDIKNNILLIPIVMISLCFIFFDNTLLKCLNILFLYILIILNTSQQFGINRFETLSFKWFTEIIPIGVIMPLENIMKPINIALVKAMEKSEDSSKTFINVLIGFVIGLPVVFIATLLLINADTAFESVIRYIGKSFSFSLADVLKRIIIFIVVFLPLYGFFYGIRNKVETIDNSKDEKNSVQVKLDFTIVVTVISLLCIIYFIYCLSQFAYFVAPFKGILPADYTYARYARKGFFECIPLGIINLFCIMALGLFTKTGESKGKRCVIKCFTYYIIAFTLFLVISAFSKMYLYISTYGITLMRVYVSWFLILGCMVLILIGVRVYFNNFKLIKSIFITFTIMFLGLNYANIDYQIAKYDADLYIAGTVDTIDAFRELSNSAIEPLIRISEKDKKRAASLLEKYKDRIDKKSKWQDWNLPNYNANKIMEKK